MPAKPKIPPALHALVMQLAGEGQTGEEIAAVLWRSHKVETTARGVNRLLERFAEDRRVATQAVLREELAPLIRPVVRKLKRAIDRAEKISRKAREAAQALRAGPDGHPQHPLALLHDKVALYGVDRLARVANVVFHYSGQNQPDKTANKVGSVTDARQVLLAKLEAAVARFGAKEPKTEPPVH